MQPGAQDASAHRASVDFGYKVKVTLHFIIMTLLDTCLGGRFEFSRASPGGLNLGCLTPTPLQPNAPPPPPLRIFLRCFFDSEKMTLLDFCDMHLIIIVVFSQYVYTYIYIIYIYI